MCVINVCVTEYSVVKRSVVLQPYRLTYSLINFILLLVCCEMQFDYDKSFR